MTHTKLCGYFNHIDKWADLGEICHIAMDDGHVKTHTQTDMHTATTVNHSYSE